MQYVSVFGINISLNMTKVLCWNVDSIWQNVLRPRKRIQFWRNWAEQATGTFRNLFLFSMACSMILTSVNYFIPLCVSRGHVYEKMHCLQLQPELHIYIGVEQIGSNQPILVCWNYKVCNLCFGVELSSSRNNEFHTKRTIWCSHILALYIC